MRDEHTCIQHTSLNMIITSLVTCRPTKELTREQARNDGVADVNDFSSEDHTIISTVTYDGSVKMEEPNTNRTDSEEDRASEQVPLQHGRQDTELSEQRLSSDNRTMLLHSNQQRIEKQVTDSRNSQKLSLSEQEVLDLTSIESSFNDGESDEHSTAVPSTLTRARRVSDREGSAAQTMTTTTSSELEFRRDLAALDADIARLQVHFQVALQPSQTH